MLNRIRDVVVVNHRLDPHETELRILVEVENLTPTTEIKGRLIGPRSAFASTVEIAYPLREVERSMESRVVIPEPSWWSPKTPFLYQGPVELWQDGELADRVQISHGIRTLQLTPLGLRLNGQPFVLRGRVVDPTCSETELLHLRTEGINTIITDIADYSEIGLWTKADRCGLLVLGYTDGSSDEFLRCKNELEKHPSNFAWAFCLDELMGNPMLKKPGATIYGVSTAGMTIPRNASFVLCNEGDSNANLPTAIPKIVVTRTLSAPLPSKADVIGWIEYDR